MVETPGERDLKDAFYAAYFSSHLSHRKGQITPAVLRQRARYFDRTWSLLIPKDRATSILDAGCGTGALIWWLQQRGYQQAVGIDISQDLVERARELGVENISCEDVLDHLSAHRLHYGVILCRDVLEHFSRTEVLNILQAAHLALTPRGRLIIQVPNAEAPLWGRIRYGDFTHEMAYTAGSLTQVANMAGFRVVTFAPAGPAFEWGRAMPRYFLWKLIELAYKVLVYGVTGRRRAVVTESIIVVVEKAGETTSAPTP